MSEAISDLLANAKTFEADAEAVGLSHSTYRHLENLLARTGGVGYPASASATNAVQTVTKLTGNTNGGTYKLTVHAPDGTSVQTAGIAYDAVHATVQTAIDTAATGHFAGWTNGDIAVTGGPLKNSGGADMVLTFSGASVAGALIAASTIDVSSVTVSSGSAATSGVTIGTPGQPNRAGYAILLSLGFIGGTLPGFGGSPSSVTAGGLLPPYPFNLHAETLVTLIRETAIAEGSATAEATLRALLQV